MSTPQNVSKIDQEYPVTLLPGRPHCQIESYCIDPFKMFTEVDSGNRNLDINSLEHAVCGLRIKAQQDGIISLRKPEFESPTTRGRWTLRDNTWVETKTLEETIETNSSVPWQQFDNISMRSYLYVIMMDKFDCNFRGKLDTDCLTLLTANKQTPTDEECVMFEELHGIRHNAQSEEEIDHIRSYMELFLEEEIQVRGVEEEAVRLHYWENLRNFRKLNFEICVLYYLYSCRDHMSPGNVWPALRWATGTYDEMDDDDLSELPEWEKTGLHRLQCLESLLNVNYFFPQVWEENFKHPNRAVA